MNLWWSHTHKVVFAVLEKHPTCFGKSSVTLKTCFLNYPSRLCLCRHCLFSWLVYLSINSLIQEVMDLILITFSCWVRIWLTLLWLVFDNDSSCLHSVHFLCFFFLCCFFCDGYCVYPWLVRVCVFAATEWVNFFSSEGGTSAPPPQYPPSLLPLLFHCKEAGKALSLWVNYHGNLGTHVGWVPLFVPYFFLPELGKLFGFRRRRDGLKSK